MHSFIYVPCISHCNISVCVSVFVGTGESISILEGMMRVGFFFMNSKHMLHTKFQLKYEVYRSGITNILGIV